ncbi:MAG: hypothetical protein JSV25_04745 [Spirochaetota bacterium]|nr:MAG: hypothetical protein JSV25_04745 [Spirochaetota bacterium]
MPVIRLLLFAIFICIPFFFESAMLHVVRADDVAHSDDLNYAQVVFVKAVQQERNIWRFEVTVRHNDEGWDHYADEWQVTNPNDSSIVAERVLAHPHVEEQPFTRSLGNVGIPKKLTQVLIRAKCNIHDFGGREVLVDLNATKGEHFKVIHLNH